jgi:hypothetical protein
LRDVSPVSITHEIIEIVQQSRGPSPASTMWTAFPANIHLPNLP